MPTVNILKNELFRILNVVYTDSEFDDLCFEYGIELDGITSVQNEQQKEKKTEKEHELNELSNDIDNDIIYKIDVPANRYDLLCVEGIARALNIFQNNIKVPIYIVIQPKHICKLNVKASTKKIRPFAVAAILRNITFTKANYNSFIELQDKLHQNICRKRTLVAIGTHDLNTIEGPFSYEAIEPNNISFIPLNQSKKVKAKELLDIYRTNPEYKHLKPYTDIIYDSPVYPVIFDKNRTVLSLPPIINGEKSKISLSTKNVFIEITATDKTKANIVLNTMVTMFSQYCKTPFTIEPVEINYEYDTKENCITPNLKNREVHVKVDDIYSMLFGKMEPKNLDPLRIKQLCEKMQLLTEYNTTSKSMCVQIPPTRADILHPVDVMEDVGIAYGYNNIPKTLPSTKTIGIAHPLNKLGDHLREEISRSGYIEILTHGLCSHNENFKYLRQQESENNENKKAVVLSNPATVEFEVVRTSMLPGLLKTVQNNKSMSLKDGLKLFEISDVVLLDPKSDVGATNKRRLCALYTGGNTDGFEIIHGLADRIMQLMGIPCKFPKDKLNEKDRTFYTIKNAEDATYFPSRCAQIIYSNNGEELNLGLFGVLHPEVLSNYGLTYPASVIEIDIEPLV